MPSFVRRLQTAEGPLSFYFNTIFTDQGLRYYISVVGRDRKVYAFTMECVSGAWVLSHPESCPHWITSRQKELSRLIQAYTDEN